MVAPTRLYEDVRNNSEALVLAHLGMVKRVALHLKVRVPPFMELDELIQVGMIGLLEAARAFDPAKGIEFESFALSRVRGAMLDEVRHLSFLPRSAVAYNKSETKATNVLQSELGRAPTQAELADHMGDDLEAFHKKRGQAKRFETFSIEVMTDEVMNIADESSKQPDAIVEHQQFMRSVGSAIGELPERDQLLMQLYYVEELNLKEIGEVLGVTESRVSQLLTAIVKKLRVSLKVEELTAPKSRSQRAQTAPGQ
ncbi:MAG: FliA/WhiG family RNA polymerase sigma factor [Betaproteobacteria bacterium]|jgi:RNA polymerase sigma factor FliA|nr:FliA/WhiG family RNA polymerase sigma factor [Betaproteobacteria bacterium]